AVPPPSTSFCSTVGDEDVDPRVKPGGGRVDGMFQLEAVTYIDFGGGMPDVGGIAGDRLKSFIERIERLEEEKKTLANDIKEVYAEAKGTGFDTKIIRQLIRLRKMD